MGEMGGPLLEKMHATGVEGEVVAGWLPGCCTKVGNLGHGFPPVGRINANLEDRFWGHQLTEPIQDSVKIEFDIIVSRL